MWAIPAGLGDRDGGVADGVPGTFQAHADPGDRAVRVAEAVLHVHDEQRPVCHVPTSVSAITVPASGPV
jgi:hypothetical protein